MPSTSRYYTTQRHTVPPFSITTVPATASHWAAKVGLRARQSAADENVAGVVHRQVLVPLMTEMVPFWASHRAAKSGFRVRHSSGVGGLRLQRQVDSPTTSITPTIASQLLANSGKRDRHRSAVSGGTSHVHRVPLTTMTPSIESHWSAKDGNCSRHKSGVTEEAGCWHRQVVELTTTRVALRAAQSCAKTGRRSAHSAGESMMVSGKQRHDVPLTPKVPFLASQLAAKSGRS
mmetsp:Transcript_5693/g.11357  ORF Transcript_5693/g.11357 Transcript_5693/m.11357 type:complete len:233 (+) Transcript_5693:73-771(+)